MRDSGTTLCAAPPTAALIRQEDGTLEQRAALERFLTEVERRAFSMARIAVRNHDDALDIVQDAMLRLVRSYPNSPAEQWPLLFFRILRNRILDHQRRGQVRRRIFAFSARPAAGEADDDAAIAAAPGPDAERPDHCLALDKAMDALETALQALPERQQQAFLLRTLEGLDVAATAVVMGCSEGSVKTHYFRAIHGLRAALGEHWP